MQKLALLGATKDDNDVNVHIVKTLSASHKVEKKMLLSSPGLTRSEIEEVVRNAKMSHKQNVGKGMGQTKGGDPHALYAGGSQPAGAGGQRGGERLKRETAKWEKQPKTSETAVATAAAAAAGAPAALEWWYRCRGPNVRFKCG